MKEADKRLVDAIRGGDGQAFEELYKLYLRRVHNFAVSKLGNVAEAEDVTQEVFAAVFSCLDRFEGKSDLVVWIYGITRNIINNRLRKRDSAQDPGAAPRQAAGDPQDRRDHESQRRRREIEPLSHPSDPGRPPPGRQGDAPVLS